MGFPRLRDCSIYKRTSVSKSGQMQWLSRISRDIFLSGFFPVPVPIFFLISCCIFLLQFRSLNEFRFRLCKNPKLHKTLKCLKISKNVTYLDGSFLSCFSSYSLFTKLFLHFHFPKTMSFLEPKTVNMFHFTGAKQTTPSCPVQLAPDFNPSSAAQSYELSDAVCSKNSR